MTVSNQICGRDLHAVLRPLLRGYGGKDFTLALVDAQGKMCARCLFSTTDPCRGCIRIADDDAEFLLQSNDTLAVSFDGPGADQQRLERFFAPDDTHPSLKAER